MTFNLGSVDPGAMPANKSDFFARFHVDNNGTRLLKQEMFRDESSSLWRDFQVVPAGAGVSIRDLQQFFYDAGFLARESSIDGVFGYATQAAARLFQEYVRTVLGDASIGTPDGVVGPNTLKHINNWKQNNVGVSDWRNSAQNPSPEFNQWIQLLEKAKNFFQTNASPVVQYVQNYPKAADTQKIADWDTSPNTIHLIGLRSGQDTGLVGEKRISDDLFVLLINGMVFKFWGSTDPDPGMAERADIPFLVEGQHKYQFAWHKVADEATVYRALRPASHGVLVFRDKDGNRALTDSDIVKGLDPALNGTINIHWSGIGKTNWSAGCQVLAGGSYINHKGTLVNCRGFAATSYSELGSQKTRGAYNVFTDLLLAYAPQGVRTIAYTLGRDETLRLSDVWKEDFVRETVAQMKGS